MRAERILAGTAFIFCVAFTSCRNDAPEKRKQEPPVAASDDVEKMDDRMPDLVRLEGAMAMTGEYKGKGVTIRLEKIKAAAYNNEVDWASWDASVSIPRDSGRYFTVKDNTIFLQLETKRKAFANRGKKGDDDFVSYRYLSRVSGMKYFLFSATLEHGGRATFLVDQRDGKVTSVLEHPSLSPNGELLLATVPGDERDGNGAVQLMKINGDSPETVFAMSCKGWSPAGIKWVNESTIVLKQERKGKDPVYARMSIR